MSYGTKWKMEFCPVPSSEKDQSRPPPAGHCCCCCFAALLYRTPFEMDFYKTPTTPNRPKQAQAQNRVLPPRNSSSSSSHLQHQPWCPRVTNWACNEQLLLVEAGPRLPTFCHRWLAKTGHRDTFLAGVCCGDGAHLWGACPVRKTRKEDTERFTWN